MAESSTQLKPKKCLNLLKIIKTCLSNVQDRIRMDNWVQYMALGYLTLPVYDKRLFSGRTTWCGFKYHLMCWVGPSITVYRLEAL